MAFLDIGAFHIEKGVRFGAGDGATGQHAAGDQLDVAIPDRAARLERENGFQTPIHRDFRLSFVEHGGISGSSSRSSCALMGGTMPPETCRDVNQLGERKVGLSESPREMVAEG
jgi:hypothetical protein